MIAEMLVVQTRLWLAVILGEFMGSGPAPSLAASFPSEQEVEVMQLPC